VRAFKAELAEYRTQFDALKSARDDAVGVQNRQELFGRRPYVTATPENPYAQATTSAGRGGSGGGGGQGDNAFGSGDVTREDHALREQNFFSSTNQARKYTPGINGTMLGTSLTSTVDEYIARGQAVLGDLGTQKEMLKNTQKRLYSVANTLGVSGDTIRMIERRALQDKWIFYAGVIIFFLFVWLVLHYLR
jgi:golgi SNAP receptor complex member 2